MAKNRLDVKSVDSTIWREKWPRNARKPVKKATARTKSPSTQWRGTQMVECPKCGENFGSEEAMEQHLEDYDHSKNEPEAVPMKERIMTSNWTGIAIVGLVVMVSLISLNIR